MRLGGYKRAFFYLENEQWIYPWFHESEELSIFWRGKALYFCLGCHSSQRGVVGSIWFSAAMGRTIPQIG